MDRYRTGSQGNENVSMVQQGWDVEDANGNKVGDVAEVASTYIVVSQGWLFPTDRYVPLSELRDVRDNKVFLNVSKDEIDQRGWDQPPLTSTTAPAGTTRDQSTAGMSANQFETPGNKYAADQLTVPDENSNPDREEGSTTGQPTTEEMQLREEQLRPHRQTVQTGEVDVSKHVVTEHQTMDVPTRHEEVNVERHRVNPHPADQPIGANDRQEIRVPVREERVTADTQPVVYEDVEVTRRPVEEQQQVSGTVRREEAQVHKHGDTGDTQPDEHQQPAG